MLQNIGFALLFFLPNIESYNRQLGFDLLLIGSVLISFRLIWERKIILDKINTLWVVMLTVFSFSFFVTVSFNRSYFEFLRYISYFLIFISIRSSGNPKRIFNLFYVPMVTINSIILAFLTIFYAIPSLGWKPLHTMTLFYPQFGHNHLADILVFAIPIAILKFINSDNRINKFIWFLTSLIFTFLLIFSFGRAALVAFSLALFIYIFIIAKDRKIYPWAIIIGLATIIILLLIFYISNVSGPLRSEIAIIRKLYRPFTADFHLKNDYQALVAWQKYPILGTGLNTFRIIAREVPPVNLDWYTHNQYLEVLSETGIIGMTAFLTLIIYLSYKNIKLLFKPFRNKISPEVASISIPFFASLVQSLFDYQWHFISIYLLYFMGFAIVHPVTYNNPKNYNLSWRLFLTVITILFLCAFKSPFHDFRIMY